MKKLVLITIILVCYHSLSAQTVKGRLYYNLGRGIHKNASGLVIYLFPKTDENKSFVNMASNYEAACPDHIFKASKNYQVSTTDNDGIYYFSNITPGKYLLRICTFRGNYYSFRVYHTIRGTYQLRDIEADVTIRPH